MGYQEYLNRSGLSDSKLEILRILGSRADSPMELAERLEQLKVLIREKEPIEMSSDPLHDPCKQGIRIRQRLSDRCGRWNSA